MRLSETIVAPAVGFSLLVLSKDLFGRELILGDFHKKYLPFLKAFK